MDNSIQFCSVQLTNYHIEFIKRQANEVAHELVRAAISLSSFHIYDDISTCITVLINHKML